nr:zinc finger, CCHC-type [Tanacetum cinerariifolium]
MSLLIYLDSQDSPDGEEDTRSSQEYMNDLEGAYQAKALLAKSKRFFKKGTQSEQIPTQKKKIIGIDQLTEDTSSSGPKVPVFVKSSADKLEVSITGNNKPELSEAEDSTLSNHDTCKHPLPPLEKLTGVEPVSGPKTIKLILKLKSTLKAKTLKGITINEPSSAPTRGNKSSLVFKTNSALAVCEICESYDHDTHGHNRIISLRRGIKPKNPQHVTQNCKTCGSNVHTTSDHNDIKRFKKRGSFQAKKAETFKSTTTLENSKVSFSIPTGGIYGKVGINTFRNVIGAHYLPHSSKYVAPPSIDIVRQWFPTIGYGEEVSTKGTLRKSLIPLSLANGINIDYANIFWEDIIIKLKKKQREKVVPYTRFLSLLIIHKLKEEYGDGEVTLYPTQVFSINNWALKPNQLEEHPFTTHMLAICFADKPVVFKAPNPSSNVERVPQGTKPGAKPRHKKHLTSSKQPYVSSKEATKAGGPTSLGVTSEATANPQLSCDKTKSVSDGLETVLTTPETGTRNVEKTSEEIKFGEIKLEDLAKLVLNVKVDFKNLDSLKDDPIIVVDDSEENEEEYKNEEIHSTTNDETEDISALAPLSPSSLSTKLKDIPSKLNEVTEEVKGLKKQVHELELELPGDLKDIPSKLEDFIKIVTSLTSQVAKLKTLQWELLADFLSLPVQVASVQAMLKIMDALLEEQTKLDKGKKAMSLKDAKEDSTESNFDDETTHVPGSTVESSKKKELKRLNDLANKKRKHVDDIHDFFRANKRLKLLVQYEDHPASIVLNEPVLEIFFRLHQGLRLDDHAMTFISLLLAEIDKRNLNSLKQIRFIEQLRRFTRREKDSFMSKGIKQSPWEMLLLKLAMAEEDAFLVNNVEGGLCVDYTDTRIVGRCNSLRSCEIHLNLSTWLRILQGSKNKHHKQTKVKSDPMRTTVVLVPTRNQSWNVGSVVRLVTSKGIAKVVKRTTQMLVVRERGLRTNPKTKVDAIAWWIDSGATTHVCKDHCWFKTYEPVEDMSVLYMGDDHFAPVHGKGSDMCTIKECEMSKDDLIHAIDENPEKYDASRFFYVYLLHAKDDALDKFRIYKTEVELQQNDLVKTLRTDRGGIIHETTAPYTPQQNGMAERKNRALREMVNSMLSYSGLSEGWFYIIEPNDSVSINSIIESRDAISDENRFSSIPRPKDIIPNSDESQRDDLSDDVPNEIPKPCKGKRVRKAKSYGSYFQLYLVEGSRDQVGLQYSYCYSTKEDPRTYNEAMQSRDSAFWKEAIDDEIGCKWIFKRKMKVDGTVDKFKARLVIQGFRQKEGIDYFDTYAPVVRITTIRLLLDLVAIQNLVIHQMDVKTAFLNGDLDEEVYMKQPKGFIMPSNEHKVCKLVKSLYGLKQAHKQWHQKFDEVVLSSGFHLNQSDKCVYSKFDDFGKGVIIYLYVDDMLIFGTDQNQVDKTKKFLTSRFSMKDMGEADVILGIKIKRENKGIIITQSHYIEKTLKMFNREDCSPVSTPMDPVEKLKPNTGKHVDQLEYSRAIGCLMFTSNPSRQHWKAITRVFLLGGGAISWASKKQTHITGSTMEYEFVALASAGKEAEWLRNLIHEILIWPKPVAPISIRCDSAPIMARAYSKIYNGKSRHLGVRHSMVRELIRNDMISIEFVRTQHNLADHLTKGLSKDVVYKSVIEMGLKSI